MALVGWAQDKPLHVPAAPWPMEWTQPDGTSVTFFLRGDEHWHYQMTTDGFVLVEQDGALYYGIAGEDGQIVAGKRIAHNPNKRRCCEKRWLRKNGLIKDGYEGLIGQDSSKKQLLEHPLK